MNRFLGPGFSGKSLSKGFEWLTLLWKVCSSVLEPSAFKADALRDPWHLQVGLGGTPCLKLCGAAAGQCRCFSARWTNDLILHKVAFLYSLH